MTTTPKTDQSISRRVRLSKRLAVDLIFRYKRLRLRVGSRFDAIDEQRNERVLRRSQCVRVRVCAHARGNIMLGDLTSDSTGVTALLVFYPDGRIEKVT